tara:strand:+ start:90 stop:362 length:273 start_codon:yes stop_codon:yes gene_type:complete
MEKTTIEGLRIRLNAKSTAKGHWYFDATIENNTDKIKEPKNINDIGDTKDTTLGQRLLEIITDAENTFMADGRVVIGRTSLAEDASEQAS